MRLTDGHYGFGRRSSAETIGLQLPYSLLQRDIERELLPMAESCKTSPMNSARRPSQVAISWTMNRSPLIHPIIGARAADQLRDNLAADLILPPETIARLNEATAVALGFPNDFIAQTSSWFFGAALVDPSPRPL